MSHKQTLCLVNFFGATSLILMAYTQILATRLPRLEQVFGALDQVYRLHKWLGIGALSMAILHETIDAHIAGLANANKSEFAEAMGEIGLDGLKIMTIASIILYIPYRWWRWVRRFIGVFFIMTSVHYFLIAKPFTMASFTGAFVGAFCILGGLAYFYTQLPIAWRGWRSYDIKAVQVIHDVTVVTLQPESVEKSVGIRYQAGQFAYLRFNHDREIHPFTISRAPNDEGELQFTIKELGDFTKKLPSALSRGDKVKVQGGYGRFVRRPTEQPEIWIAGGVGITPFVAWAQALTAKDMTLSSAEIHLFYCVQSREKAVHLSLFEQTMQTYANFHLHLIDSATMPRLDKDKILEEVGDLSKSKAYFCGPRTMRTA